MLGDKFNLFLDKKWMESHLQKNISTSDINIEVYQA